MILRAMLVAAVVILPLRKVVACEQFALAPSDAHVLYALSRAKIYRSTDAGRTWSEGGSVGPGGPVHVPLPLTPCLAVDPSNALGLYVTMVDYILKSTDGGTSFKEVFKSQGTASTSAPWSAGTPTIHLGTIGIDPADPEVVYVSVEVSPGSPDMGLLRTEDSGTTWKMLSRAEVLLEDVGFQGPSSVMRFLFSDAPKHAIYASSPYAIFKSMDRGGTWAVYGTGVFSSGAVAPILAFDPADPNLVYAMTSQASLFKSADAGASWQAIARGVSGGAPQDLLVDSDDADTLYLSTRGGVFKTVDGGGHWRPANIGLSGDIVRLLREGQRPPSIYALAWGDGLTWGAGVYKSTDRGESWSILDVPTSRRSSSRTCGARRDAFAAVSSSDVLYAIAGRRLHRSEDAGRHWTSRPMTTIPPSHLDASQLLRVVTDPNSRDVLYVNTGQSVFKSTDGGSSFAEVLGSGTLPDMAGGIATVAVDPNDSKILYASVVRRISEHSESKTVARSDDAGATWRWMRAAASGWASGTGNMGFLGGIDAFAFARRPVRASYATNSFGVFKSLDGGESWLELLADRSPKWCDVVVHPAKPDVLFVVSADGDIFASQDGGRHWEVVGRGLTSSVPGDLVVDPKDPNTLYLGTMGGVLRSTDGGHEWGPANSGLARLHAMVNSGPTLITSGASAIYARGEEIVRSRDGAQTWTLLKTPWSTSR